MDKSRILNLYLERGSDYSKEITLYDEFEQAINLSGKTISSYIATSSITPHVAEFTTTVIDTATGKIK